MRSREKVRQEIGQRVGTCAPGGKDRRVPCRIVAFACIAGLSWAASAGLTGCGTPAAPQPPSLKLPGPAEDLTAIRAGDNVTLRWTNPRKNTDRLLIAGVIPAQVCRQGAGGACEPAGQTTAAPGAAAEFHETLPAALTTGQPRVVHYFVELKSPHGRTAGPSNIAEILAGAAPAPISGLTAEVRADGVALHWQGGDATAVSTPVRLHRRLLTDASKPREKKAGQGLMQTPEEPVERDLLVEAPAGGTLSGSLDATARFGESYEYTAQRVARVSVDGQMLELPGATSAPLRVAVVDRFPPAVPQSLVAVAATEAKSIDLSWQPDTDADLAGYIVYRREDGAANSTWKRISGPQPLPEAAYRDLSVSAGTAYRYRVTAIDLTGHESAPSDEARESMPNP